jgi:broad specificity phosphatase PhoE
MMDVDSSVTLTFTRLEPSDMAQPAEDERPKPVYDARLRELRVGQVVSRVYRQPAQNQEALLQAFQKAKWKRRIKAPKQLIDDKRRLRETLDQLNTPQKNRPKLIHFSGDGTGSGVIWKRVDQTDPS